MAWKYGGKNIRPFSAVCENRYGRQIIYTNQSRITADNIADEISKAITIHNQNAKEITYLDNYYRGDQPIRYRSKKVRPEVNNRIVQNLALFVVETKASEIAGEPIQYVLRGTDEEKAEQIANLNALMEGEDKSCDDIELCRWRSICGTAYRFIGTDEGKGTFLDETPFFMTVEEPTECFVAYYSSGSKAPAYSCQIRKDEEDREYYFCYTQSEWFKVQDDKVIDQGLNGNGMIPLIEYPNNARRMSDIEITIDITDSINKMASDRTNGIEQFVSAWVKFINCEIDEATFHKMRDEGALVVKSNNGSDNKADVDVMTSELNQTQGQVVVDNLYNILLVIQGIANREGNTGGDTQGAVMLRDGFYSQEKRSEMSEPIFKKSERMLLRVILNKMRIKKQFTLMPSDVEIHISRTKRDNMQTKAQVLQILLACGIDYERAIKTAGLFGDPEQVAIESRERMEYLYPTQAPTTEVVVTDGTDE